MTENISAGGQGTVCTIISQGNYTLHTFRLLLEPYGTSLSVDVGNVATGNFLEDSELFDSFDPQGIDESPRVAQIRNALEIEANCDEYSGPNLAYFLNEELIYYGNVNCQIGFTESGERQLFTGVTLLHIMPDETLIRIVFRRAAIVSQFEWPFGNEWSETPILIRSLPDKTAAFAPFGYLQIEPCREAVTS